MTNNDNSTRIDPFKRFIYTALCLYKNTIKQIKTNTMTNTQTQKETKSTYNGWTNYATWRIALEWFDDFNPNENETDVYDLSKQLESYVEETLEETSVQSRIVLDYALAFTSDVNWYEIAEHLINEQNN